LIEKEKKAAAEKKAEDKKSDDKKQNEKKLEDKPKPPHSGRGSTADESGGVGSAADSDRGAL
jgi:hypothetical protein